MRPSGASAGPLLAAPDEDGLNRPGSKYARRIFEIVSTISIPNPAPMFFRKLISPPDLGLPIGRR